MDAMDGVRRVYLTERSIRIQAALGAAAMALGLLLDLSRTEWLFMLAAVSIVLMAETFNSAVEAMVDLASPGFHPLARLAKHTAAGGVVFAVTNALAVGAIVLLPKVLPSVGVWAERLWKRPYLSLAAGLLLLFGTLGAFVPSREKGKE